MSGEALLIKVKMNLQTQVYVMRKRIDDKTLLKILEILNKEVERRQLNDERNSFKDGN